ncbi:hypothetical protein FRACYDRAFT_224855 [Fragilariopsis cylindrus CCMP1102]|uniref:Saccharopine dehydrogenase NADP binding domain-containing protein n=1 Tax=Fragilariopsis cylindrus CCMP1102 TaxID=635003 RepID=A0A1E7FK58_9STRA|nr:hypothetical protein FRACYDRAFT_224855 [Fragilariopsis cylindrus CCMP1102]|eukprot:OEU18548.1 hypothetical protein FRACYDRAFT_224855 [Fragilariopsis cylindrus CCMP1102]
MSTTTKATFSIARIYDIIIYGATGFTGQRVATYLHQTHPDIKLAIAGRNISKLTTLAESMNLPSSHIYTASAENRSDLVNTLSKATVVIACAGPYRHCGETIVSSAIEAQTHYLDLCGEPQFFDDMLAKYDRIARENKTLIISACAFDCVPAELSAKLASKECFKKYGKVTNLEIVHTFQNVSAGNPTTFHAAVDGFHAAITGQLKKSRQDVNAKLQLTPAPNRPGDWPKIVSSPGTSPVYHPETNTYLLKFMGADAACILASDRYDRYRHAQSHALAENDLKNDSQSSPSSSPSPSLLEKDPLPRMSVCFGVDSKSAAYKILGYGAIFSTLARFQYGCKLLHGSPELFTNGMFREGGPTEEEMQKGSFETFCTAYGMNREEKVRVSCKGPEPGYVATPKIIVALAVCVLRHRDEVKYGNDGGVMVPGVAFGESDAVFDLLKNEGIEFKVLNEGNDSDQMV